MRRARSERDLAYRAEVAKVGDAHMKLAALHVLRLRQFDEAREASA